MAPFNKNLKRKSREQRQNKPSKAGDTAPTQALPLQFDDDVPDFPRGLIFFEF